MSVTSVPVHMSRRLRRTWQRSPRIVIGGGIFGLIVLAAILAPLIAPSSPTSLNVDLPLQAPSAAHLFGTDDLGRDVLTRVLYGGRPTLAISAATVACSLAIGVPWGIVAGYRGGRSDLLMMRTVEFGFVLPPLVLDIAIIGFLGVSDVNVVVALTIVFTPMFARVARAATLPLQSRPFILAARAVGESDLSIMVRQVAPNVAAPVLVQTTLAFAYALLAEASLSFLGLGTQEPVPSWGRMLREALSLVSNAPWTGIFPGAAIAVTVLSLNLLGDGLRDALDPTARQAVTEAAVVTR